MSQMRALNCFRLHATVMHLSNHPASHLFNSSLGGLINGFVSSHAIRLREVGKPSGGLLQFSPFSNSSAAFGISSGDILSKCLSQASLLCSIRLLILLLRSAASGIWYAKKACARGIILLLHLFPQELIMFMSDCFVGQLSQTYEKTLRTHALYILSLGAMAEIVGSRDLRPSRRYLLHWWYVPLSRW